jgi:hypothetical protein
MALTEVIFARRGIKSRGAAFPRNDRPVQRLAANVRQVIFDPLKAKPDALTLRLAVCDFA